MRVCDAREQGPFMLVMGMWKGAPENRNAVAACSGAAPVPTSTREVDAGPDALVLKALAHRQEERFTRAWGQPTLPTAEVEASFDSLFAGAETAVFQRELLKLPLFRARG